MFGTWSLAEYKQAWLKVFRSSLDCRGWVNMTRSGCMNHVSNGGIPWFIWVKPLRSVHKGISRYHVPQRFPVRRHPRQRNTHWTVDITVNFTIWYNLKVTIRHRSVERRQYIYCCFYKLIPHKHGLCQCVNLQCTLMSIYTNLIIAFLYHLELKYLSKSGFLENPYLLNIVCLFQSSVPESLTPTCLVIAVLIFTKCLKSNISLSSW